MQILSSPPSKSKYKRFKYLTKTTPAASEVIAGEGIVALEILISEIGFVPTKVIALSTSYTLNNPPYGTIIEGVGTIDKCLCSYPSYESGSLTYLSNYVKTQNIYSWQKAGYTNFKSATHIFVPFPRVSEQVIVMCFE